MLTMDVELTVPCPHCGGTSRRKLFPMEVQTLNAMRSSWTTTEDILARIKSPVSPTALCNRLIALRKLGLVESRPMTGRRNEWRVAASSRSD